MCTYLDQVGSTYYFRRSVPEELQPLILTARGNPRTEFKISLRTKDRETAKRLLREHADETDRKFDAARLMLGASTADVAPAPEASRLSEAEIRWEEERRSQEQRATRIAAQEEDARLLRIRITGKTEQMHPADAVIARAIRDAEADSSMWRTIAERAVRSMQGGGAPAAPAHVMSVVGGAESKHAIGLVPASLTGLFDAYVKTGRLTPSIAKEWRAGVDRFVAFIGHDDARRFTTKDILLWRNHARGERQRNGKPRSPQRVNAGYLGPLRAAFGHGISEMLIDENPATAVPNLPTPKKAVTRDRQFTKEERQTILNATLTGGDETWSPYRRLVRRWVPWLCAYSGARVNEMTQLRAEDVQQIDGIWIIRITPDAGRVKTGKFRNVPIHEHLIAQGFLAMVEAQVQGPLFYDPEKGEADSERGQYKKAGERLATWVRSLGVTDPGIMPNHAWRHTFTSRAMDAGMDERAADYIKGQSSVGVSRRHYTHHTVEPLAKQMAMFPRYELE